jgi:hypothetical protein
VDNVASIEHQHADPNTGDRVSLLAHLQKQHDFNAPRHADRDTLANTHAAMHKLRVDIVGTGLLTHGMRPIKIDPTQVLDQDHDPVDPGDLVTDDIGVIVDHMRTDHGWPRDELRDVTDLDILKLHTSWHAGDPIPVRDRTPSEDPTLVGGSATINVGLSGRNPTPIPTAQQYPTLLDLERAAQRKPAAYDPLHKAYDAALETVRPLRDDMLELIKLHRMQIEKHGVDRYPTFRLQVLKLAEETIELAKALERGDGEATAKEWGDVALSFAGLVDRAPGAGLPVVLQAARVVVEREDRSVGRGTLKDIAQRGEPVKLPSRDQVWRWTQHEHPGQLKPEYVRRHLQLAHNFGGIEATITYEQLTAVHDELHAKQRASDAQPS